MKLGVVMPVGPGRAENVVAALDSLEAQTQKPVGIVVVEDGSAAHAGQITGNEIPIVQVVMENPHVPGMEQPRNIGVRYLAETFDVDHVWFVDSDIIFTPDACEAYHSAHHLFDDFQGYGPEFRDRILVGPYDWLAPGDRMFNEGLYNDPRWPRFSEWPPERVGTEDIGSGLACFSGNLVWPIDQFTQVGGFWNELHHGRCEDGELGLRATALGVPISFVSRARGQHLWHPINHALAEERNARDVPMLNERHPWVQGEGLAVVPKDGRRFDALCPTCEQMINTVEMWTHTATCGKTPAEGTIIPEAMP